MATVSVELRGARELMQGLDKFKASAVPFAVKEALNSSAFKARERWQMRIRSEFINRNKFTQRSIRVERAMGMNTNRMSSVVGSTAPYMRTQEFGGTVRGRGGRKGVPGPVAAGGSPGAGSRTSPVKRRFYQSSIQVTTRGRNRGNRKQRNASAIRQAAAKTSTKFVVLQTAKGEGLFRVLGSKRKRRIELLWRYRGSVRVDSAPTLGPVLKQMTRLGPVLHKRAIIKQLKRHRILGY